LIHRELARDDGGAAAVAVLEDLQEVVTGRGIERLEAPVVEDQQIDAAERAQQTGVAAVAASQGQIGEQPRDALIEHGAVVAAGLVAERRGEPAFTDAGRPADQKVGVVVDPLALDQHCREAAVEATLGAIVDVLDAGLLAQLGVLQPLRQSLVASQRCFAFEQQRKPFGVAEACGFAAGFDVGEGLGHAVKAELMELIEGRMREQDVIS
jgi:hypothetical protein